MPECQNTLLKVIEFSWIPSCNYEKHSECQTHKVIIPRQGSRSGTSQNCKETYAERPHAAFLKSPAFTVSAVPVAVPARPRPAFPFRHGVWCSEPKCWSRPNSHKWHVKWQIPNFQMTCRPNSKMPLRPPLQNLDLETVFKSMCYATQKC